jgi:hypothetical protein
MPERPSPTAQACRPRSSRTSIGGTGPTSRTLGRILLALCLLVLCSLRWTDVAVAGEGGAALLPARIDAAARMLRSDPRLGALSESRRRDTIHFIVGNLLFVLMHEVGHAAIAEMGLPVLGREEDAADSFATVSMIRMKDAFSERVLAEAAKGWFYADRRDRVKKVPVVFYDSHSLDRQRAYQIVCLMVGSDPVKFADLAKTTGLPQDRQGTCRDDFNNADWSWNMLLKDHRRTTQPKTAIPIRYGEPGDNLDLFARIIRGVELLEVLAERISEKYVWRAPFTIEARTCGESGAEWNYRKRTLTVCYEIAEEFAVLYSSYSTDAWPRYASDR